MAGLSALLWLVAAAGELPATVEVRSIPTLLFSEPDSESAVVRRVYVGEVLEAIRMVETSDGGGWIEIRLGEDRTAFVQTTDVVAAGNLPHGDWAPPLVIRDERPLGIGIKGLAECFGPALALRYLVFSRLGLSFSVGSVLEAAKMRGTAISGGINSYFVLWNLSPYVEAGFARLSYHKGMSTLRLTTFYLTVGIEYMFDVGLFVSIGGTYLRSADVEVAYEYEDARAGSSSLGYYGVLDLRGDNAFQAIRPGMVVGYAF